MKFIKIISMFLIFSLLLSLSIFGLEIKEVDLELKVKSAVLIDADTGLVLYSYNMNEKLPPASVTKIMTLLLVFEALDSGNIKLDEKLTVSENASSMGGSQVFLEPGEEMSVDELIKCVAVASANDAALTLAERIGGSEEAFVSLMNNRARELGMNNTTFENVTGLDDTVNNHLTSAYDIALMSSELLKHKEIINYTTIWMDTIRNGEFGLSNTNRLIKYYKGITGLKTGFTRSAGFCVSASAKRGEMHLIAVVMGAETSNDRNLAASKLLDFGFANYGVLKENNTECGKISVIKGKKADVIVGYQGFSILENISNISKAKKEIIINDNVTAPIYQGDCVGKIIYKIDDKTVYEHDIVALETVEEMTFFEYFVKVLKKFVLN